MDELKDIKPHRPSDNNTTIDMKKVLIINASSKVDGSYSRKLASHFETSWSSKNPEDRISHRDIGTNQIPHITEDWICGAFKPEGTLSISEKEALSLSDTLVQELQETDILVIATPMYNWSIPSTLKAYIDQVIRSNQTLGIDPTQPENPYVGLVKNKKAYLLLVRGGGGYNPGEFNEHMEFQKSYLNLVLNTIGIKDVETITMDLSAMGPEIADKSYNQTTNSIDKMI